MSVLKSIKVRLLAALGVLSIAMIVIGGLGLHGMNKIMLNVESIRADRLLPSGWLSEISAIQRDVRTHLTTAAMLRTPAAVVAAVRNVRSTRERIGDMWDKYNETYFTSEERRLADEFWAERKRLLEINDRVIAHLEAGRFDEAQTLLAAEVPAVFDPMIAKADQLLALQIRVAEELVAESQAQYAFERWMMLAVIGFSIALAGLTAFLLIRAVIGGMSAAARVAETIAGGHLGAPMPPIEENEVGAMLRALQAMDRTLLQIVGDVRTASHAVGGAASQLSRGNDDLSQRTQEQAAALEETASSMEQMTATVKQNADNARQANQLAASARGQAEKGGLVVTRAVGAMQEINSASSKIADIIGVIDEIAFQTNLLALNAAVEAARAGEQGRGFAVVASEVRSLAQRSAAAAKEIKELIGDSVEKVRTGAELVDDSGKVLAEIMESVKKVSDIVAEIAAASEEQAAGIEQVNNAVTQMDSTTQQNAALVEQSTAAAKAMEQQARELVAQVAYFKDEAHSGFTARVTAPAPAPTPLRAEAKKPPARARSSPRPVKAVRPLAKASGDDSSWQEF